MPATADDDGVIAIPGLFRLAEKRRFGMLFTERKFK